LDKSQAKDSHATSTSFLKYRIRGLTKGVLFCLLIPQIPSPSKERGTSAVKLINNLLSADIEGVSPLQREASPLFVSPYQEEGIIRKPLSTPKNRPDFDYRASLVVK